MKNKMKLYEIPDGSPLRIEFEDCVDDSTFHHIDGMYSYCLTSNFKPFHLSAVTPVKLVNGRYEIDEEAMEREEILGLIYSRCPKGTKEIVEGNPKKQKRVDKIMDKIFEDFGDQIRALAKE